MSFYKNYMTIECVGLRIFISTVIRFLLIDSCCLIRTDILYASSTETGVFQKNYSDIKATDVLDPCVARSSAGSWFDIKMSSYQYSKSHCGDKTVVRSSYIHNGISYTGKINLFIESGPWGPFHERFTRRNSNSNQNSFQCNSTVGNHFVTIFCACHGTIAAMT